MAQRMYSKILKTAIYFIFFAAGFPGQAQPDEVPVIDAGNIDQLAPVVTVDFDALAPEAGQIINGRVFVSADGRQMAVVNRSGQVVILDDTGRLLDITEVILTGDGFPAVFIDGSFSPAGHVFAALHTAGSGNFVTLHHIEGGTQTRFFESEDRPTAIWLDESAAWLEVVPDAPGDDPYILRIPADVPLAEAEPVRLRFAPAQDESAVARIGRLPLPFTVTADKDGLVSRWDLSEGLLTATALVDNVPIYGAMTPDARYLVWRDPASTALHLLDFDTGDDQVVVPLDGMYIPFILLTVKADVIIGVDVNDEPIVMAWVTGSGQQHPLGLYRQCGRPPDMVVLSRDGGTLVIGCDRGLEIWRVAG